MIAAGYHDDLKEVQGDAALAALLRAPKASSPFDRIEWWQGLVDCCGFAPVIAVASRGEHRAILPLARRGGGLQSLANWYSFRSGPVFSANSPQASLLASLARGLSKQATHLRLFPVPDENSEAAALVAALRSSGWTTFIEPYDVNHVLPVRGRSFADYLAARPGHIRSTLKRKRDLVGITIHQSFDTAAWNAYEAVYAESWKGEEGCPGFLRRFAEEEGAAGRLRLAIAKAQGRPVAAQFWTVEAGTAFIHKLAHVEDACALSPGTTLTAALLEQVIDNDRVSLVDFGTGDDPYKRDWMESVRTRYRIEAFRPERPANWLPIARKLLQTLAAGRAHG